MNEKYEYKRARSYRVISNNLAGCLIRKAFTYTFTWPQML